MTDLLPHDKDAAGEQLYIDRLGRYCRADGTPTGWRIDPAEARALWAGHPHDTGEELADLLRELGLDKPGREEAP
jgi:hypothetical protein